MVSHFMCSALLLSGYALVQETNYSSLEDGQIESEGGAAEKTLEPEQVAQKLRGNMTAKQLLGEFENARPVEPWMGSSSAIYVLYVKGGDFVFIFRLRHREEFLAAVYGVFERKGVKHRIVLSKNGKVQHYQCDGKRKQWILTPLLRAGLPTEPKEQSSSPKPSRSPKSKKEDSQSEDKTSRRNGPKGPSL